MTQSRLCLIVAKSHAGPRWWDSLGIEPKEIFTHWPNGDAVHPPRIKALLSNEQLYSMFEAANSDPECIIQFVGPCEPQTREEVTKLILHLYEDGSEEGIRAADAMVELMAHLDKVVREKNNGAS